MTLIEELYIHKNDNNINYIEELEETILEEDIKTVDDLIKYEIKYNRYNGKNIQYKEMINNCIKEIDEYPYEYDGLSFDEIRTLKKERRFMNDDNDIIKIYHIIKYYYLTNRYNPFPYMTYQFIIKDKI